MPHYNIWIRKEDDEKWKSLKNKAEFMHDALGTIETLAAVGQHHLNEFAKENDLPKIKVVEKVYKKELLDIPGVKRAVDATCKHGAVYGQCRVFGCKFYT